MHLCKKFGAQYAIRRREIGKRRAFFSKTTALVLKNDRSRFAKSPQSFFDRAEPL